MAGIGFELTKLTKKDNLLDVASAFLHTAIASVGPWLFTVLTLAIITFIAGGNASGDIMEFRTIVVYNFSVSLVLSSPIFMIATRVLSDSIHAHNVTSIPSALFKSIALVLLVHLPIGILWYVSDFYILPLEVKVFAFANLFLIAMIWVLMVFLMGLKDYIAVSRAFFIGLCVAIAIIYFSPKTTAWMIGSFTLGLAIIASLLISRIMAEYPYKPDANFKLKPFFYEYWPLAVGGFCYNAAIWVDKWIMWYAPEATQLPSLMRIFPDYDQSMFIAIIFTVPAFVLFVFSVETNFFHHYQRFFGDILDHKPLSRILRRKGQLIESVYDGARQLIITQGLLCVTALVIAVSILKMFDAQLQAINIFRFGIIGGFFHLLMLTATIILSYFDCRKQCMWIYAFFLIINLIATLITLSIGYDSYGFGYFIASISAFVLAVTVLLSHLRNLTYHAFITNNISVK